MKFQLLNFNSSENKFMRGVLMLKNRYVHIMFAFTVLLIAFFIYKNISKTYEVSPILKKNNYKICILKNGETVDETIEKGIIEALNSSGYKKGKNLTIEIIKCSGIKEEQKKQVRNLIKSDKDLIITIGPEMTEAITTQTDKVPVVAVGVSDIYVKKHAQNKYNLTGVLKNDLILQELNTINRIVPIKNIGIVYNTNNQNSINRLKYMKEVLNKQFNINILDIEFINMNNFIEKIGKIKDKTDAIYIPENEIYYSYFDKIIKKLNDEKIPVISDGAVMVEKGALLSVTVENYRMGFDGGLLAAKLLDGNIIPCELSFKNETDPDIFINMAEAKKLKLKIPSDIWQKARKMYLYEGQSAN